MYSIYHYGKINLALFLNYNKEKKFKKYADPKLVPVSAADITCLNLANPFKR